MPAASQTAPRAAFAGYPKGADATAILRMTSACSTSSAPFRSAAMTWLTRRTSRSITERSASAFIASSMLGL